MPRLHVARLLPMGKERAQEREFFYAADWLPHPFDIPPSGSPVSRRLLRLARIFGQPPETASIIFDFGWSISWMTVSFTAPSVGSISIVHFEKPSAVSSGRNSLRHFKTTRFGFSISRTSPQIGDVAVRKHHLPWRALLPLAIERDAEPVLLREFRLQKRFPKFFGSRADEGDVDEAIICHRVFLPGFS